MSDSSRRVVDAAPLGLAAFGGTTFLLSFFLAGTDALLTPTVFATALFFGGLAQLVAGIVEFRQGSTFGATAFTAYGTFWIGYGLFGWLIRPTLPADDVTTADGLFTLPWAILTLYLVVATLRISGVLLALVSGAFITLSLVTAGSFADSVPVIRAAGAVGFVTAAIAWYGSFAGLVNGTWGRHLVPIFPDPGKRLARLGHGRPRVHSITSSAGERELDDDSQAQ
ncbi:acetate uptake transporter [Asanoa sp. NPDC049518]|uniref:acetate uptake transporter n=1 Tax=unclassified Asanoa TaxID=2685164 RepID=UPI00342EFBD6